MVIACDTPCRSNQLYFLAHLESTFSTSFGRCISASPKETNDSIITQLPHVLEINAFRIVIDMLFVDCLIDCQSQSQSQNSFLLRECKQI